MMVAAPEQPALVFAAPCWGVYCCNGTFCSGFLQAVCTNTGGSQQTVLSGCTCWTLCKTASFLRHKNYKQLIEGEWRITKWWCINTALVPDPGSAVLEGLWSGHWCFEAKIRLEQLGVVQYIGTLKLLENFCMARMAKDNELSAPFWLFQFCSLPFAVVNTCCVTGRVLAAHIHPPQGWYH